MVKRKKQEDDFNPLRAFAALKERGALLRAVRSGELEQLRKRTIEDGGPCWAILRYRRIADPEAFPFPLTLESYVRPKTFEKHLKYLLKECRVMPLQELIHRIDEYQEIPDKTVAITFDGGHADNFYNALPLLCHYQVHATFFLAAFFIGKNSFFFQDRIALAMKLLKEKQEKLPLFPFLEEEVVEKIKQVSPELEITEKATALLALGLRNAPPQTRYEALLSIVEKLGGSDLESEFYDFLSWQDAKRMQDLGFSFGTMGHMAYSAEDVEQDFFLNDFIEAAKRFRQNEIQMEEVFCYPGGTFTLESMDVLKELHARYALLARDDIAQPKFQTQLPMLLGRVPVHEAVADSDEAFACHIWGYNQTADEA